MNTSAKEHSIFSLPLILARGLVWGQTYERKRQVEFIQFLEYLDKQIPPYISQVHIVLDNLRMHLGKQVQAWLAIASSLYFSLSPGTLLKG